MRWITNMPESATRSLKGMERYVGYWCSQHDWNALRDKIIGEPMATATKTAEELKREGYVGVYDKED